MKKDILNKAIVILLVLTAFGCRTRKLTPVVVASPTTAEKKVTGTELELLKKIFDRQATFNTVSIKSKADLNMNNKTNGVNMNIRMQKAKVIWISVSAPIIGEVARTIITPDSIKILNKLESTYTRKPFSYIYQYANNQINFETLQNIFIGNAMSGTLTPTSTVEINGGQSHIKGNLPSLAYLLIFNENLNLIQSNVVDKTKSQALSVNYGDYKNVNGQTLPNALTIKSNASNKSISLDLHYTQVGLNEPLDFPFSVPKRYTVKD